MHPFTNLLLEWFAQNSRSLPWRETNDPYAIWLSEIILQQTRVQQGMDYWYRFMRRWPDIESLARSSEDEVLRMWQGLGYYSRARNLHKCARQVVEQYGGIFPSDFEQLRKLQGIGNYTAAAISSIAFNQPHAVVDGNVYRVLSRLYDIDTPINTEEGKQLFAQLANDLLDYEHPGRHNQALMEFGALQCQPQNHDCLHCPLQSHCLAFDHHTVEARPVKEKRLKTKTRYFHYLVLRAPNHGIYLRKRESNDIWKKLYDFPCVENDHPMTVDEVLNSGVFNRIVSNQCFQILSATPPYTHKLTHQTIVASFFEIKILDFLTLTQKK